MIEVEIKYYLTEAVDSFRKRLERLAEFREEVEERDTYYNSPLHLFEESGEALRIREQSGKTYLTYKGPLLSTKSKARKEIEMPLASFEMMSELLEELRFFPVAQVRKRRLYFEFDGSRKITFTIDRVDEVGQFVEIETLAEPSEVAESEREIKELAESLELIRNESKSYLELLLERREERS